MLKFNTKTERVDYALSEAESHLQMLNENSSVKMGKVIWLSFLTAVDGVRQALIDSYKGNKGHNHWYAKFSNDMKNDELLVYMRNARNNAQHFVTKTPLENCLGFKIFDKNGQSFQMDSIQTSFKDGHLKVSLESKSLPKEIEFDADFYALNATAMPVTNNGIEYLPPSKHQGVMLFSIEIIHLAELSLGYYRGIVDQARKVTEEEL